MASFSPSPWLRSTLSLNLLDNASKELMKNDITAVSEVTAADRTPFKNPQWSARPDRLEDIAHNQASKTSLAAFIHLILTPFFE